jgi:hypothetical protein
VTHKYFANINTKSTYGLQDFIKTLAATNNCL